MPDIIVKAAQLNGLHAVLAAAGMLTPPPSPKGRYALAKALKAVTAAAGTYSEQHVALCTLHAKKDDQGKAISRDAGEGRTTFDLADRDAFAADYQQLNDEEISLPGTRVLTRAELADCPITIQQEAVLIECGLLEDKEPE